MLSIPWASRDPSGSPAVAWAQDSLESHGIVDVTSASNVGDWSGEHLREFDGFFIGGGNTFLLLSRLIATGLRESLRDAYLAGKPCYGGSAGAIVFGVHIGTCAHLDSNEVALGDLGGLDLGRGLAVWPHYAPGDDGLIERFSRELGCDVISLSENAGACFEAGPPVGFGDGDAAIWHGGQKEPL